MNGYAKAPLSTHNGGVLVRLGYVYSWAGLIGRKGERGYQHQKGEETIEESSCHGNHYLHSSAKTGVNKQRGIRKVICCRVTMPHSLKHT